jgi:dihydropteroate synthase
MQNSPLYEDVVAEVGAFLCAAIERAIKAGVSSSKIIIDPGIGFGKRLEDNLEIIRNLNRLALICTKDYPLLMGLSRKRFTGEIIGGDVARIVVQNHQLQNNYPDNTGDRLSATLAANAVSILGGAAIIRVHDVREHLDLAKMLCALKPISQRAV